jgi:kumamolisin
MAAADRVTIPGSERQLDPDHTRVGDVDGTSEIELTVYLRPRAPVDWVDREAAHPPAQRRVLSREEFAGAHGASGEDVAAVRAFASETGLTVSGVDQARRAVSLRGTVDQAAQAFGAEELGLYKPTSGEAYRGRQGALTLPSGLDGVVTGVFGIDNRRQAHPRLRRRTAPAAPATSYTPVQVAQAYDFPPAFTGAGEAVGILELGGGFSTTDLATYFQSLNLTPPTVTAVSVDGASNSPGTDTNADGEVMLDIEVVGAVAPGASIAVYFAPNTDQGFIDGLSTAINDTTNKPSVISISWGQSEDSWTAQARAQMEQTLTDAAALGVTVTVAAGDNGSTDGVSDGQQHVDFPASAPHALACGGTSLQAANGQITSETVWNDGSGGGATGGGVSDQFPVPSYQTAASVPDNVDTNAPGRGVPDVAGNADPETGYQILVDGKQETIGGTSAVAPLWAGLIARLNQSLGKPVGFLQPQLYPLLGSAAFHDITGGNNGSYSAGPGWDACTGLGSPDGSALSTQLAGGAGSGSGSAG